MHELNPLPHLALVTAYRSYSPAEASWLADEAADIVCQVRRRVPFEFIEHRVCWFLNALESGLAQMNGGGWVEWALAQRLIWPSPRIQFGTVAAFAWPRLRLDPWEVGEAYTRTWIRSYSFLLVRTRRESDWSGGPKLSLPSNSSIRGRLRHPAGMMLEEYCSLDALTAAVVAESSAGQWKAFVRWSVRGGGKRFPRRWAMPEAHPCMQFVRSVAADEALRSLVVLALLRVKLLCGLGLKDEFDFR